MNKLLATLAIGAAAIMAAPAATVEFTYNDIALGDDFTFQGYGFSKKETFDVAIRIIDPALVGAKITSMRVPIPSKAEWVKDLSAWLSSDLKLDKKVNAPDIASVPATLGDDLFMRAEFTEPYTLTEEGVYVGYSFTVTELHDYSTTPVAVLPGISENGLFVHSSRSVLKWTATGAEKEWVSPMVVTLETVSGPTDVAVALDGEAFSVSGGSATARLTLLNYGDSDLNEIGISWEGAAMSGTSSALLSSPIPPGAKATVPVEFGSFTECGDFPLTITVDKFNGEANNDPRRTVSGTLAVLPFMPETRPLFEEYTGLQCQYCPRGYVAMEQMSRDHGDNFIGMAYHSETYESGCMVTLPNDAFPVACPGYPYGTINRERGMDPGEFPSLWEEYTSRVVPADLDVTLDYTDDTYTAVHAKVSARFARCMENPDMILSLAIIADGLQNENWGQMNAFAGGGGEAVESDLWDLFTKGKRVVKGLTFNDVVAYYPDVTGVEGSVNGPVNYDSRPSIDLTVNIADIRNVKGENFLNNGSTLRAVGILLNARSGAVINCNKSASIASDYLGIGSVESEADVIAESYFDLQGRTVSDPAPGTLLIVRTVRADGSVIHTKRVAR